jgi:hypothetical protein
LKLRTAISALFAKAEMILAMFSVQVSFWLYTDLSKKLSRFAKVLRAFELADEVADEIASSLRSSQ